MFRSAIEQAELEYLVELPDQPLVVDIDREMWSRIVVNLLSNAYKFTAHGRIRLRLGTSTDGVALTVEDTGVGIERGLWGACSSGFSRPTRPGPKRTGRRDRALPGRRPGPGSPRQSGRHQ
jgi:K+-sensing histidine kinase KdpD